MSMERETVTLDGGPLHGQQRLVHPDTRQFVEEIPAGTAKRRYGGVVVDVARVELATYRRHGGVFRFAATQTAMGHPNPTFWTEEDEWIR